jgi:hypothetical protein
MAYDNSFASALTEAMTQLPDGTKYEERAVRDSFFTSCVLHGAMFLGDQCSTLSDDDMVKACVLLRDIAAAWRSMTVK